MTFDEFYRDLSGAPGRFKSQATRAANTLGREMKARAKEKLGTYQEAIGEWEAWAPLSEATRADRDARGYSPDEPLLREGDLRRSIKFRVKEQGEDLVIHLHADSPYAEFLEFGTSKMPPRAFLGPAAWEVIEKRREMIAEFFAAAIDPSSFPVQTTLSPEAED